MWNQPVVMPRYDATCFSHLPALIHSAITGEESPLLVQAGLQGPFRKVITIFADAFGWRFFSRYADGYPALRRFLDQGSVVRLTSQFPSTTAAHVTTMFTGEEVGQHGVYEWNYYEPSLDMVITPLLFTYAGSRESEKLWEFNPAPERMFPPPRMLMDFEAQGVKSYVFLNRLFAHSTFSTVMTRGAEVIPFATLPQALTILRYMLLETSGPALFHLYYEALDAIAHEHGPESPHLEAEIDTFLTVLERQFFARVKGDEGTLVLLFADHGVMKVSPETTMYVNRHPLFERLRPLLRTNARGDVLAPAGSPRDMFFYVREGAEEEARDLLARITEGRADVVLTRDLIEQGAFGNLPLSGRFTQRVGNVVVLPHPTESVWWYEKDRFEQKQRGHHGGLSPEEMEIPLLMLVL